MYDTGRGPAARRRRRERDGHRGPLQRQVPGSRAGRAPPNDLRAPARGPVGALGSASVAPSYRRERERPASDVPLTLPGYPYYSPMGVAIAGLVARGHQAGIASGVLRAREPLHVREDGDG